MTLVIPAHAIILIPAQYKTELQEDFCIRRNIRLQFLQQTNWCLNENAELFFNLVIAIHKVADRNDLKTMN